MKKFNMISRTLELNGQLKVELEIMKLFQERTLVLIKHLQDSITIKYSTAKV